MDAENEGYKQSLNRRQVQMIAIGGAIGTGLFLGSASRLRRTVTRHGKSTVVVATHPNEVRFEGYSASHVPTSS